MGLLDKALTIESTPSIDSMVESLKSAGIGLDFPSVFFTRFTDLFSIKKGALLLPEEDGKFVPWSVRGFDQTTSRRIRIPDDLMGSLKNSENFSYIELKDSEIDLMKNYFSFREYSVTETLLISPIFADTQLIALLFISEGQLLVEESHNKKEFLKNLSDAVGPLLHSRRETIVSKFEGVQFSSSDLADKISRFISEDETSPFIVLSLSLESFIAKLMNNDPSSIRFRIMQDILRLVKTMIAEKGEVYNKGNDQLIILIKGDRETEAELLVHQIGLSLGYFFKIDTSGLSLSHSMISYPRDGQTAKELVSQI